MQKYVNEIKNYVSCPPKIYSQLYLATLSNYIIHCPVDLLKQRLKLTIAALKLRQGVLLPKNVGAETIAAEEAQWTFALFSGCLLKDLGEGFAKRVIPAIADNWLQKNILLFKQWQEVILSTSDDKNDLEQIISVASKKYKERMN